MADLDLLAKHQISYAYILSIIRRDASVRDFLIGRYKNLMFKALNYNKVSLHLISKYEFRIWLKHTSCLQVNYYNFFTHFSLEKYHEVWQSWNDTKEVKDLSRFMPTEKGRTLKSKPTGVRQESIEPSVKPGLVLEQFSLGPEFLTLSYLFWEILKSKICSLNFGLNIFFTAQGSSIY